MISILPAAAIGLVVVVLVFALVYSPGSPHYTLTRDKLTIHDRFYPVTLRADEVDAGRIQIVDLATDNQWRPTVRTNGFSNFHYHAGWYRVGGGQKIRLYRADSKRLVLLPPRGTGVPVLYEVPEPERFVADVRRAWTGDSWNS